MKAKDMFLAKGFELINYSNCICYWNKKEDKYIWFYLTSKTVEIEFSFGMDLLQAINQQMKEIGVEE